MEVRPPITDPPLRERAAKQRSCRTIFIEPLSSEHLTRQDTTHSESGLGQDHGAAGASHRQKGGLRLGRESVSPRATETFALHSGAEATLAAATL